MRSNFIKELESCRVTFQGPFCKHPIGILTVCVCKSAHVCVQEGTNGPRSPLGDCWWFSGIIFQNTNAACFELAESVPSRGQRSGDCHIHTSLSAAHRKAWQTHCKRQSRLDLLLQRKNENRRLTFLLTWLAEVQRSSVPLESEAVSRLMASSVMRFENFP